MVLECNNVDKSYIYPLVSRISPFGPLKVAATPVPSTELAVPDPANVVTTPATLVLKRRKMELKQEY